MAAIIGDAHGGRLGDLTTPALMAAIARLSLILGDAIGHISCVEAHDPLGRTAKPPSRRRRAPALVTVLAARDWLHAQPLSVTEGVRGVGDRDAMSDSRVLERAMGRLPRHPIGAGPGALGRSRRRDVRIAQPIPLTRAPSRPSSKRRQPTLAVASTSSSLVTSRRPGNPTRLGQPGSARPRPPRFRRSSPAAHANARSRTGPVRHQRIVLLSKTEPVSRFS
jgi:hypothetical protein